MLSLVLVAVELKLAMLQRLYFRVQLGKHLQQKRLSPFFVQQVYGCTSTFPINMNLFKFDNRNTRKRCETCLQLTINTQERRYF